MSDTKLLKHAKIKRSNLKDKYEDGSDWVLYCDDGSMWTTNLEGVPIQMGGTSNGSGGSGTAGPPGQDGKDFVVTSDVTFSFDYGNLDNMIPYPIDKIKPTFDMMKHKYWAITKMNETAMRFVASDSYPLVIKLNDSGDPAIAATSGNITSYNNSTGEWVSGSYTSSTVKIGIINCNHTIENQITGEFITPKVTQQQMRGSTEQLNNYAGERGQLVVNTDTYSLHVMDGITPGGHPVTSNSAGTSSKISDDIMQYLKYTGAIPPDNYHRFRLAETPTNSTQRWEYMGCYLKLNRAAWLDGVIPIVYDEDRVGELIVYECPSASTNTNSWVEVHRQDINLTSSTLPALILISCL